MVNKLFSATTWVGSCTELLATVEKRKIEGENDKAEFVLSYTKKNICELITKTWLIQSSPAKLERSNANRMEEIERSAAKPCGAGSNQFISAFELHFLYGIDPFTFSYAIITALIKGRKKYNNILLTGPTNCGKTFLLKFWNKFKKSIFLRTHSTINLVG